MTLPRFTGRKALAFPLGILLGILLPVAAPAARADAQATGQWQFTGSMASGTFTAAIMGGAWTATVAPLPADAASHPGAIVRAAACPSASSCVGVGTYYDSSKGEQVLVLAGSGTSWTAAEAAPPANAGSEPITLFTVACASASYCVATGFYYDSSGNQHGLLVTGSGTSWTTTEAPLPANAANDRPATLTWVACASASSCVATGTYTDSSGNEQGLLLAGSGTSWTATEAPLPGGAASDPDAGLGSVACAPASSCVAAGDYTDSSGNEQGLLLAGSGTSWTATEAPLPGGAASDPDAGLGSVACAPASSCVAAGTYTDSSGNEQGLLLAGSGTSWTATEAPLPAGAASDPDAVLSSVACAPASSCVADGTYIDSSGNRQGLLLAGSGTSWTATEAPLPAGATDSPVTILARIACTSASFCVVLGLYEDSSGNRQGLLLTGSGTSWAATEGPVPTNAAASPFIFPLESIVCASASSCVATGSYFDSSGNGQGLLVTGPGIPALAATITAAASSVSPSVSGQPVTYTATVSPAPDGGTVAFTDNGSPIIGCAAQPVDTSTGQATCQTTPSTTGAHNIVAAYSGSSAFAGSTSAALTQVVTGTPCPSLAGCNLHGLDLTGAQLAGADLTNANLNGANLTGADMSGADLAGANLNKADLSGADLAGADVAGANFNKVTWSNTTCPDGTNSDADGGTCTGHL